MRTRVFSDQVFCSSQVACEGAAIRSGTERALRPNPICPACEKWLSKQSRPSRLRGENDRFTRRDGRKRSRTEAAS